jgi:hypothetical protein
VSMKGWRNVAAVELLRQKNSIDCLEFYTNRTDVVKEESK